LVIKENPAVISSISDPVDFPDEPDISQKTSPTNQEKPQPESLESKDLDEEGQITLNF